MEIGSSAGQISTLRDKRTGEVVPFAGLWKMDNDESVYAVVYLARHKAWDVQWLEHYEPINIEDINNGGWNEHL